ncbi:MAG: hypothetical protein IT445_10615 [Phycisphaeraceae bacterium]|nr:hypothetical protein [Phycisphaeraceae bacterium]
MLAKPLSFQSRILGYSQMGVIEMITPSSINKDINHAYEFKIRYLMPVLFLIVTICCLHACKDNSVQKNQQHGFVGGEVNTSKNLPFDLGPELCNWLDQYCPIKYTGYLREAGKISERDNISLVLSNIGEDQFADLIETINAETKEERNMSGDRVILYDGLTSTGYQANGGWNERWQECSLRIKHEIRKQVPDEYEYP